MTKTTLTYISTNRTLSIVVYQYHLTNNNYVYTQHTHVCTSQSPLTHSNATISKWLILSTTTNWVRRGGNDRVCSQSIPGQGPSQASPDVVCQPQSQGWSEIGMVLAMTFHSTVWDTSEQFFKYAVQCIVRNLEQQDIQRRNVQYNLQNSLQYVHLLFSFTFILHSKMLVG